MIDAGLCGYTFGLTDFAVSLLLGGKYQPFLFSLFVFTIYFLFQESFIAGLISQKAIDLLI